MKKLKKFQLGNLSVLSRQEMINLSGGKTYAFNCGVGDECSLYITSLGIVVEGKCNYHVSGTSVSCFCQNGRYHTGAGHTTSCWK